MQEASPKSTSPLERQPFSMLETRTQARHSALSKLTAVGVIAAGFASVLTMLAPASEPDWSTVSVLLVLGCIATQMRLQLPGVEGVFSLAFIFTFAAVAELPALWAFAVIAIVEIFEYVVALDLRGAPSGRAIGEVVFRGALAAMAVRAATWVLGPFTAQQGFSWAAGLGLAAAAYFAVYSSVTAVRDGAAEGVSPWAIWRGRFFWVSPLYLLAPFGVMITRLLINPESFADSLLAVGIIGAAYWYLRSYFPRLHDQQDHAQKLAEIRQRALETLAVAIEAKDGSTAGHLQRVKMLATRLGARLHCNAEEIRTLQLAAVLHDVGKVGVPDYILQKPSRLTEREFEEIATHAAIGADIVSTMEFPEPVEDVVLSHHEHWDGSGYPRGLSGADIPRLARILTVVDCFDALVSDRPYRKAMSIDEAVELMTRQRGKIFDPGVIDEFLGQLPNYLDEIKTELAKDIAARGNGVHSPLRVRQTWVGSESDIDFSSRIKSLQELSRRPDLLVAFYDAMSVLGADLQFERMFAEALRVICETTGASSASILLYSMRREHFVLQASAGLPTHCLGRLTLPATGGPVGRAAEMKVPAVDNLPPTGEGEPPLYFEGTRCSLAAPLTVSGRLVGLLLLCSERPSAFDQDQTRLVSLLTSKLASTLIASQQLRKIHIDANTDAVTSLPNARASFQRLEQELNRAHRQKQTVGVLFMDLDGLKPVNDSYGHAAGDRLLAAAAARLTESLRSYDFVGRIGGDEFLAILPGIRQDNIAKNVALLKSKLSETPVELGDGIQVRPMISIGAALYPDDAADPDKLVYLSDKRMYDDKERSRRTPPDNGLSVRSVSAPG